MMSRSSGASHYNPLALLLALNQQLACPLSVRQRHFLRAQGNEESHAKGAPTGRSLVPRLHPAADKDAALVVAGRPLPGGAKILPNTTGKSRLPEKGNAARDPPSMDDLLLAQAAWPRFTGLGVGACCLLLEAVFVCGSAHNPGSGTGAALGVDL